MLRYNAIYLDINTVPFYTHNVKEDASLNSESRHIGNIGSSNEVK